MLANRISEPRYGKGENSENLPFSPEHDLCPHDTLEAADENSGITETQPAIAFRQADETELQDLINRIVYQDQNALAALFKLLSHRVHSIALRITKNTQLAEEVTEDTFYQVWRQAPRFDPQRGPVAAWVLTIARSRALDAWRAIPPFEPEETIESGRRMNLSDHEHGEDILLASEQNQLLHEALLSLEPLPRQLVSLSFFKGLSHEEIALHMMLPLGTVKSHLRRAVLRLREQLSASTYYSVSL